MNILFGSRIVYPAVGGESVGGIYITVLFNGSGSEGKTHPYYRAISGKVFLNREQQSRCSFAASVSQRLLL